MIDYETQQPTTIVLLLTFERGAINFAFFCDSIVVGPNFETTRNVTYINIMMYNK
jgi:hypothetical protein